MKIIPPEDFDLAREAKSHRSKSIGELKKSPWSSTRKPVNFESPVVKPRRPPPLLESQMMTGASPSPRTPTKIPRPTISSTNKRRQAVTPQEPRKRRSSSASVTPQRAMPREPVSTPRTEPGTLRTPKSEPPSTPEPESRLHPRGIAPTTNSPKLSRKIKEPVDEPAELSKSGYELLFSQCSADYMEMKKENRSHQQKIVNLEKTRHKEIARLQKEIERINQEADIKIAAEEDLLRAAAEDQRAFGSTLEVVYHILGGVGRG